MHGRPPKKSRFEQAIAVTLVTSLVLSMSNLTAWASAKGLSAASVIIPTSGNPSSNGLTVHAVGDPTTYQPILDPGSQQQGTNIGTAAWVGATMTNGIPPLAELENVMNGFQSNANPTPASLSVIGGVSKNNMVYVANDPVTGSAITVNPKLPSANINPQSNPTTADTISQLLSMLEGLTQKQGKNPYQSQSQMNGQNTNGGVPSSGVSSPMGSTSGGVGDAGDDVIPNDEEFQYSNDNGAVDAKFSTADQSLSTLYDEKMVVVAKDASDITQLEGYYQQDAGMYEAETEQIGQLNDSITKSEDDVNRQIATMTVGGADPDTLSVYTQSMDASVTKDQAKAMMDKAGLPDSDSVENEILKIKDEQAQIARLTPLQQKHEKAFEQEADYLKDLLSQHMSEADINFFKTSYQNNNPNSPLSSIIGRLTSQNVSEIMQELQDAILHPVVAQTQASARAQESARNSAKAIFWGAGTWAGTTAAVVTVLALASNPIGWAVAASVGIGFVAGVIVTGTLARQNAELQKMRATEEEAKQTAKLQTISEYGRQKRLGDLNASAEQVKMQFMERLANGNEQKQVDTMVKNEQSLDTFYSRVSQVITAMKQIRAGQKPVGTMAELARQLLNQAGGSDNLSDTQFNQVMNKFAAQGAAAGQILMNHLPVYGYQQAGKWDQLYTKDNKTFVATYASLLGMNTQNDAGLNGFFLGNGIDRSSVMGLYASEGQYAQTVKNFNDWEYQIVLGAANGDTDDQIYVKKYIGLYSTAYEGNGSSPFDAVRQLSYQELANLWVDSGQQGSDISNPHMLSQTAAGYANALENDWAATGSSGQEARMIFGEAQYAHDHPFNAIAFGAGMVAGVGLTAGSSLLLVAGAGGVAGSMIVGASVAQSQGGNGLSAMGSIGLSGLSGFLTTASFANSASLEAIGLTKFLSQAPVIGTVMNGLGKAADWVSSTASDLWNAIKPVTGDDIIGLGLSKATELGDAVGGLAEGAEIAGTNPLTYTEIEDGIFNFTKYFNGFKAEIAAADGVPGYMMVAASNLFKVGTLAGRVSGEALATLTPLSVSLYGVQTGLTGDLSGSGLMGAITRPADMFWTPIQNLANAYAKNGGFGGSLLQSFVTVNKTIADLKAFGAAANLSGSVLKKLLANDAIASFANTAVNAVPMLGFYHTLSDTLGIAVKTGNYTPFIRQVGEFAMAVAGAQAAPIWDAGALHFNGEEAPISLTNEIENSKGFTPEGVLPEPVSSFNVFGTEVAKMIGVSAVSLLFGSGAPVFAAVLGGAGFPILEQAHAAYNYSQAPILATASNILEVGDMYTRGLSDPVQLPAQETFDRAVLGAEGLLTTKRGGTYLGSQRLTSDEMQNPVIQQALENRANRSSTDAKAPADAIGGNSEVERELPSVPSVEGQSTTEIRAGLMKELSDPNLDSERESEIIAKIKELDAESESKTPTDVATVPEAETPAKVELPSLAEREQELNNNLIDAQKNLLQLSTRKGDDAVPKAAIDMALTDVAKAQRALAAHYQEVQLYHQLPGGDVTSSALAGMLAKAHEDAALTASRIPTTDASKPSLYKTTGELSQAQAQAAMTLLKSDLPVSEHEQTLKYMADSMVVSKDAIGNLFLNGVHVPEGLMPAIEQVYNAQHGIAKAVTVNGMEISVDPARVAENGNEFTSRSDANRVVTLEQTGIAETVKANVQSSVPKAELNSEATDTLAQLKSQTNDQAMQAVVNAVHDTEQYQQAIATERNYIQSLKEGGSMDPALDDRLAELDLHQAVADAQAKMELPDITENLQARMDALNALMDSLPKLQDLLNAQADGAVSIPVLETIEPQTEDSKSALESEVTTLQEAAATPEELTADQKVAQRLGELQLQALKAQMRGDLTELRMARAEQESVLADAQVAAHESRLQQLKQTEEGMNTDMSRQRDLWTAEERAKAGSDKEIARRVDNREAAFWETHGKNIERVATGEKPWSANELEQKINARAADLNAQDSDDRGQGKVLRDHDLSQMEIDAKNALDKAHQEIQSQLKAAQEIRDLNSFRARTLRNAQETTDAAKKARYLSEVKNLDTQIQRARLVESSREYSARIEALDEKAQSGRLFGEDGLTKAEAVERARLEFEKTKQDYQLKLLDASPKAQEQLLKEAQKSLKPLTERLASAMKDLRIENAQKKLDEMEAGSKKLSDRLKNIKAAQGAAKRLAAELQRRVEVNDNDRTKIDGKLKEISDRYKAETDETKREVIKQEYQDILSKRSETVIERKALLQIISDLAKNIDSTDFAKLAQESDHIQSNTQLGLKDTLLDNLNQQLKEAQKIQKAQISEGARRRGLDVDSYVNRMTTGDAKAAVDRLNKDIAERSQNLEFQLKMRDAKAQQLSAQLDLATSDNPISKVLANVGNWQAGRALESIYAEQARNIFAETLGKDAANQVGRMSGAEADEKIQELYKKLNDGLYKDLGFKFMPNQEEALKALLMGKSLNLETSGGKSLLAALFAATMDGQVIYVGPTETLTQKLGTTDEVNHVKLKDLIEQVGMVSGKKVYNIDELYKNYQNMTDRQGLLEALRDSNGVLLMSREVHGFLYSGTKNDGVLRDAWNALGEEGTPVRLLADEVHNLADPMNFILSDASDKTLAAGDSAWMKSKAMAEIFKQESWEQISSDQGDAYDQYQKLDIDKSSKGIGWYYDRLSETAYLTDAAVIHIQNELKAQGLEVTTSDIVSFAKGWGQADLGLKYNRPVGAIVDRVASDDGLLRYKVIPVDSDSKRQDTMTYSDSIYAASFVFHMEAKGLASDRIDGAIEKRDAEPGMVPLSNTRMQVTESQAMTRYDSVQGMTGTSDGVRALLRDKMGLEVATISSARDRGLDGLMRVTNQLSAEQITDYADKIKAYIDNKNDPKSDPENNGYPANLRRGLVYGLNDEEQKMLKTALEKLGLNVKFAGARELGDEDQRGQLTAETYYGELKNAADAARLTKPADVVILTTHSGIEGVNWRGEYIEVGDISDLSTSKYKQFINRVERQANSGTFAADRYFFIRDSAVDTLLNRLRKSSPQQDALLSGGIWYSDLSKDVEVNGKSTTVGKLADQHLGMPDGLFLKATSEELRERAVLLENHPGLAEMNGKLYDMKDVLTRFLKGDALSDGEKALLAMHYRQAIVLTNGFRGEINEAFSKTLNLDPLQRLYVDALKRESDMKELMESSPSAFAKSELAKAESYRKAVETAFQNATNPENKDAMYKPEMPGTRAEDTVVRSNFENQRASSLRVWKELQKAVPYEDIQVAIGSFIKYISGIDVAAIEPAEEGMTAGEVHTVEQAIAYAKKLAQSMLPMEANEINPSIKLERDLSRIISNLGTPAAGGPAIDVQPTASVEPSGSGLEPASHGRPTSPIVPVPVAPGDGTAGERSTAVTTLEAEQITGRPASPIQPAPSSRGPMVAREGVLTIPQLYTVRAQAIQVFQQMGNKTPTLIASIAVAESVQQVAQILYTQAGVAVAPTIGFGSVKQLWQSPSEEDPAFLPRTWATAKQVTGAQFNQGRRSLLYGRDNYHASKGLGKMIFSPVVGLLSAVVPVRLDATKKGDAMLNMLVHPSAHGNLALENERTLALMVGVGNVTTEQISTAMVSAPDSAKKKMTELLNLAVTSTPQKFLIGDDGYTIKRIKKDGKTRFVMTVNELRAFAGISALPLMKLSQMANVELVINLSAGDADHLQAFHTTADKYNAMGAKITVNDDAPASWFSTIVQSMRQAIPGLRVPHEELPTSVQMLQLAISDVNQKVDQKTIQQDLQYISIAARQIQEGLRSGLIHKDHLPANVKALIDQLASASTTEEAVQYIQSYLGQAVSDAHANLVHEGIAGNAPMMELTTNMPLVAKLGQALDPKTPQGKVLANALRSAEQAAAARKRIQKQTPEQAAAYAAASPEERHRQDLYILLQNAIGPASKPSNQRRTPPAQKNSKKPNREARQILAIQPDLMTLATFAATPDGYLVVGSVPYPVLRSLRERLPNLGDRIITGDTRDDFNRARAIAAKKATEEAVNKMLPALPNQAPTTDSLSASAQSIPSSGWASNFFQFVRTPAFVSTALAGVAAALVANDLMPQSIIQNLSTIASFSHEHVRAVSGLVTLSGSFGFFGGRNREPSEAGNKFTEFLKNA